MTRRRLIAGAATVAGAAGAGRVAADVRRRIDAAEGRQPAERLAAVGRRRWSPDRIGTSTEGRPIMVHTNLIDRPRFTIMVIAAVHGDERGAGAVGTDLLHTTMPPGVNGVVVPIANPDGWERNTRNNARDVDLNRNFPYDWRSYSGGPGPASEPETQAVMEVVRFVRPDLVVWVHQPYEYVAPIAPAATPYADAWARAAGLPLRPGVRQHGGGETWSSEVLGLASILVEGTGRTDRPDEIRAHRQGFEAVLAML